MAVVFSQPIQQALWIQNGRLRAYVNGKKVVDVNQVKLPPLQSAQLWIEPYAANKFSYRMVRIAESTPDFSQTIAASGRYVTHGIYFDTDSDRLQPDSAAVLKSIAAGLQKESQPALVHRGAYRCHRRRHPQSRSLQTAGRGGSDRFGRPVRRGRQSLDQ